MCSNSVTKEFVKQMAWQPTSNVGIKFFIEYGIQQLSEIFDDDMSEFW